MDSLRRSLADRLAVATSPPENGPRTVTSYSESNLRQYWMPDAVSVECYECSARFTTFRRKHHCRVCGQIFCSKCCNIFISGKYLRCTGTLRVCVYCHKHFSQQHQATLEEEGLDLSQDQSMHLSSHSVELNNSQSVSPSSSFLDRTIPNRLSNFIGATAAASSTSSLSDCVNPNILNHSLMSTPGGRSSRKRSSVMLRPNFLTKDDDIDRIDKTERVATRPFLQPEGLEQDFLRPEISLKDPHKLDKLWEQIVSAGNGIALGTHRYQMKIFQGCFLGNDIIEWLQARDGTTWRSQAMAFGQALLDAGYLEDLTSTNQMGLSDTGAGLLFDEKIPYRPILQQKVSDSDLNGDCPADSVTNHFDADGPDWLQQVDFPMEGNDYDMEGEWRPWVPRLSTNLGPEITVFEGVRDKARETSQSALQIDTIDSPSVPALDDLYRSRIEDYLRRLVQLENLSPKWTELIRSFCLKIVSNIKLEPIIDPDLKKVNMDIRDFVKIKRIPGGSVEDCSIVKGEVFSNRVIRVGMPLSLDNTNVLLVKDSIAYAREDRYVSLGNMKLQEEEYTKNICHKIKSFKPELILVEKTVCRSAQDILCEAGIAVVLNVKSKVLKRVSRLFGTPIVESLGSIVERPILGACDRYRSRMFNDVRGGEPKNLISLEGRDLKTCCTILLRGGSGQELAKVKRIIRRMLLVKLHCKYERSFLLHEDVQTEAFSNLKIVRFQEMTLSPFVSIPCSELEFEALEGSMENTNIACDDICEEVPDLKTTKQSDQSCFTKEHCPFESFIFTKDSDDISSRNLMAEYRAASSARARKVKPKLQQPEENISIPKYYKLLESKFTPMLFGSHAPTTVNYCVAPWVVKMSFYHQNDIPLGVFLDSFCFDDSYKCPSKKECTIPMRDHVRRFCLGDACVTLVLQSIGLSVHPETNTIFMWKFCNECRTMSTILPLGYNSWMLSFSMFLLLCLNETNLSRKSNSDDACPHSIHRDQFTCFAKGDLVALFKVSPIVFCSLVFPSSSLSMPAKATIHDRLLTDLKDLSVKGSNLFSQINGKIVKIKSEGIYESFVSELLQEQEVDQAEFRHKVDAIGDRFEGLDPTNCKEMESSVGALLTALHTFYLKWEAKLQQIQELKRREEKLGKSDNRAKGGGGTTGFSTPSMSSSSAVVDKALVAANAEKLTGPSSLSIEENLSAPSRIWHNMIASNLNEPILTNPLPATVHPTLIHPETGIVVDEAQPTSIITFALSKPEYHEFLASHCRASSSSSSANDVNTSTDPSEKHFKCQFSDDICQFYVCVQFAYDFHKFREKVLLQGNDTVNFVNSLSECKRWASSGGKSGMLFYKTRDDRFIIKEMSGFEKNSFQDFASDYFQYIIGSIESQTKTLLGKIVGVFTVGFKNSSTGHSLKIDILVIENLFYKRNIQETYDLKGSVRNRLANEGEKTDDSSQMQVKMDENLLKIAREKPFYIRKDKNPEFYSAIHRDTNFLMQHFVMDYSLLVGIDAETDDLVLGIIDYIRTFTWDKKIEMIIKSSGILGGRGKTPTIIDPKFYQKRFIEAMDTYFIQVPDYWYQFNQSAESNNSEGNSTQ